MLALKILCLFFVFVLVLIVDMDEVLRESNILLSVLMLWVLMCLMMMYGVLLVLL